ncbi:hypothetical protein CFHF_13100 [Caulobacter flavus]|uniref:Uncharacterized protein n=1 Tax=Caulobacter flavus TaxID=1679497 RepID=A0A2N5CTD1_9CAUL|nr:hypothetical protein [Caulobacter flavus]AYV49250.1 hypothetical protein C1707_25045 [Caulobacter flavus]PLR14896.1 hypothetical protein CFHF_13100 [Caulobacter flavus]
MKDPILLSDLVDKSEYFLAREAIAIVHPLEGGIGVQIWDDTGLNHGVAGKFDDEVVSIDDGNFIAANGQFTLGGQAYSGFLMINPASIVRFAHKPENRTHLRLRGGYSVDVSRLELIYG